MSVQIIKCFIASPSDTSTERNICDSVVNEINRGIAKVYNIRLETIKWENDVRPAFGEYGQAVINHQIGDDYDIFIGLMYKKFGTPTKVAGSGTEEEFNNAYKRYTEKKDVELMLYFNDAPIKPSEIDSVQLNNVNLFKRKIESLGGIYCMYDGFEIFKEKLQQHLTQFLLQKYGVLNSTATNSIDTNNEVILKLLNKRLEESLCVFESQPIIWVEPVLSRTNDISQNADDNYNNRVELESLIENPKSTVIEAPPQFGLTSLAHFLIKEAWIKDQLWIYLDAKNCKPHTIHNAVKNEVKNLGLEYSQVKCIVFDGWNNYDNHAYKKLKNLCDANKDIPIFVMQTIDEAKFFKDENEDIEIDVDFESLYLLALPRAEIRKVVCEYNKAKSIGDEDKVLNKVVSDLEILNIHRTPYNCLTLLKVSEKLFDESPVNRTKMLEMVLFVLFDMDSIPVYKNKPDLKDCEYVLGRFCEDMIRGDIYEFTREYFQSKLSEYCTNKLIDLEVGVVFDVLYTNNIIIMVDFKYIFKASFWIFYFSAKRMHNNQEFADYIFSSKKYLSFPEIVEFYTGIDRNRSDALMMLMDDMKEACNIVREKVGMSEDIKLYNFAKWEPTDESIERMHNEISENVLHSRLPESVKDQFADRDYDQRKPYNQSIQKMFEQYSLYNLLQNTIAASRALRNSDYVDPDLKRTMLDEILRSWEQLLNILLALSPIMATKGFAEFEGTGFFLSNSINSIESLEEKINVIIQVLPTNVVGMFKNDLYSSKLGPLIYEKLNNTVSDVRKHHLALFIIFGKPRGWKDEIEKYIVGLSKNSYFLADTVSNLRARYRYDFVSKETLREIEYLIKLGLAKHHYGDKKPVLSKVTSVSNLNLPKREYED